MKTWFDGTARGARLRTHTERGSMDDPQPVDRLSLRDLPAAARPRERLQAHGAEALSDAELLCCVLGRGTAGESVVVTAHRLLQRFGDLRGVAAATVEQLGRVRGIGPAKAAQLAASAELARRLLTPAAAASQPLDRPDVAAAILWPFVVDKRAEHVLAALLDARYRLIRVSRIAVGSLSASLVHPRELFKEAIAASAAAVIVAHNHPSGDPQPSDQDIALTKRLVQAGKLLGIEVLDHLILAAEGTVSLRAAGVIA
jgi:DNA repair protein RadC